MAQEEFDFESFKNEAIAGLYSGKKNDLHRWGSVSHGEALSGIYDVRLA
ncbi:hypothetical protein GNY06_03925 [Elizabethkingia argentiflava]|uniref:Uncharacterized protein n=1 Tax=Elizabethkingia argenteiflava TaxID=2681556 RepID=A0A845PW76_9FLAO|nr:hypothetical protein [Elizabethkingia argenteiflava]NAW50568.1 hypothetical protein [Elizabethkingia argenteiflava]